VGIQGTNFNRLFLSQAEKINQSINQSISLFAHKKTQNDNEIQVLRARRHPDDI